MSLSIAELRAMSDDAVIAAHDGAARNTVVGTAYWMDELERRSRERVTESSNRLARASFRLGVVATVASVIAVVISVLALVLPHP